MVHIKQLRQGGASDGYVITYSGSNWAHFGFVNFSESGNVVTCNFGDDATTSNIVLTADTTCTIQVSDVTDQNAADLIIRGGNSSGAGDPGDLILASGNGSPSDGYIRLRSGTSDYLASIGLHSTNPIFEFDSAAGGPIITQASSAGVGETMLIQAQSSTGNNGGQLLISGGDTSNDGSDGGDLLLAGGDANGSTNADGGNVYLIVGDHAASGTEGQVIVSDSSLTSGRNLIPAAALGGSLGTASNTWSAVYTDTIVSNDVCFTDERCAICGHEFAEGDNLLFKLYKKDIEGNKTINRTVPIHAHCTGS